MAGELVGLRKAAVLMVLLGPGRAAEVLARCHLDSADLERLAFEIARLGEVSAETRRAVAEEFSRLLAASAAGVGGAAFAQELLARMFGHQEAARLVSGLAGRRTQRPFAELAELSAVQLVELLRGEAPQVVAVVLRYLPRPRAAEVLAGLAPEARTEVVLRLLRGGEPSQEVVSLMGRALRQRAASLAHWEAAGEVSGAGGPRALVEILTHTDLAVGNAVLESLAVTDPELGEQVRESMFVFEDLPRLDPRSLQEVLREVEAADLALALKGAPEVVRQAVFENLSENAAAGLREDLDSLGPVRRRDVYAAQQKLVDLVRERMREGSITLRQEDAAEELVV